METIQLGGRTNAVSDRLFGLFLEDINWACDGGLNANMVNNYSFDGVYFDPKASEANANRKEHIATFPQPLRFWHMTGGSLEARTDDGISDRSGYARVGVSGSAVLQNRGYDGGKSHIGAYSMNFVSGGQYRFTCFLRGVDFAGTVSIRGVSPEGSAMTGSARLSVSAEWNRVEAVVTAEQTGCGALEICFDGTGCVDLDVVTFMSTDTWGGDDPKWTGGHFRRDLVEAMAALKPKFLRFPGGCITEGTSSGNEYNWKDSVGPLWQRKGIPNLWALRTRDKGYFQSYQIGFYEYFCLCEDLHMEPLPVVWAGHSCQFRSFEKLLPEHEGFRERVIDSALDLIEFANGDPEQNPWAKLRADMGHPAPFDLKLISIGNENWGSDYFRVFGIVKAAIDAKYPGMTCVFSTGAFMGNADRDATWEEARKNYPDVLLDEHFYQDKSWLYSKTQVYESYERCGPQVFLGEYAAYNLEKPYVTNTFASALAEAAYLTGVERHTDLVTMTSYAPLFCMAGGGQWHHDLIFFNHSCLMKTPNYFVQQMYSNNIGTHALALPLPETPDLYTSATEDADTVYVKAVNSGRKRVELTITGTYCGGRMTLLHSTRGSDKNHLDFSGAPRYTVEPVTRELPCTNGPVTMTLEGKTFAVFALKKAGTDCR